MNLNEVQVSRDLVDLPGVYPDGSHCVLVQGATLEALHRVYNTSGAISIRHTYGGITLLEQQARWYLGLEKYTEFPIASTLPGAILKAIEMWTPKLKGR